MKKALLCFKRAFLAVLVAVMAVCFGFAVKLLVPSRASAASAPSLATPVATYCLGEEGQNNQNVYYEKDFAEGWAKAVRRSAETGSAQLVKVILYGDWTADADGFGSDELAFSGGRLYVPKNAHVWLDLNGHKLDRALKEGKADGSVLGVVGTLEIDDGSIEKSGEITGAYNTNGYGGALTVQNGTVNLRGGAIKGNKVSGGTAYGAGVFLSGGATFNIYNGTISGNEIVGGIGYGGGVAVYDGATLTMNGGTVSNNGGSVSELYGGGIAVHTVNSLAHSAVNLLGGTVSENNAVVGGGLAVCGKASVTLNGVAFTDNTATRGGGVAVNDGAANVSVLNASIARNQAQTGGGVLVSDGALTLAGGQIGANVANATGSAVAVTGGELKMNGGSVASNTGEAEDCAIVSVTGGSAEFAGGSITNNVSHGATVYVGATASISNLITANQSNAGAVALGEHAKLTVLGNVNITNNTEIAENASSEKVLRNLVIEESGAKPTFGAFGSGAQVGISVKTSSGFAYSNAVLSDGYANVKAGTEGLRLNPMNVLLADVAGQRFALNKAGNVVGTDSKVKFTVTYAGDPATKEEIVLGATKAEAGADYAGVEFVYGEKTVTEVTYSVGDAGDSSDIWTEGNDDAGEYVLNHNVYLFTVVVKPYVVSADELTCTVADERYDGNAKEPEVTVMLKRGDAASTALTPGTDYTVTYRNNTDAGRADAVVELTGNYSGTHTAHFTIAPSETPYAIEWQYYTETTAGMITNGQWNEITDPANTFTYDPMLFNQNNRIRAKLTAGDTVETVYMASVRADRLPMADENRNANMRLALTRSGDTTELDYFGEPLAKGAYYVFTVVGSGNYALPAEKSCNIVLNTLTVDLTAEDFALETTEENLFLVDGAEGFGHGYVDPTTQEERAADFARYTGEPIALEINEEFRLSDGRQLKELGLTYEIKSENVTDPAAGTTGAAGKVHIIATTVTVTPGRGVQLESGAAKLTLSVEWHIVTVNNDIRLADGSAVTNSSFPGWNYCQGNGRASFRPEHGDTVIYTYMRGSALVRQFAVVFENDEANSPKTFYEVKTENGAVVPDTGRVINSADYFTQFNKTLKAGSYVLTVRVPASEAKDATHLHWWEGNRVQHDDQNTVYNQFERSFNFTVAPYSVSSGTEWNFGFSYTFLSNSVEYNGQANNTPELTVSLYGVELVEGEDYVLTSSQINVGTAELTIEGIDSLTGRLNLEERYGIVKAYNYWAQVPNVIRWNYGSFDRAVNVFEAVPALLDNEGDLLFSIAADENGTELVEGLESFSLEYGFVSETVAAKLRELPAGVPFYLIVKLEGNDNYYGLSPATVEFRVFTATNVWDVTPGITSWTAGRYDAARNAVQVASRFGMAEVTIKNADGDVVYNALGDTVLVDKLASAKAGNYTLTASVAGSNDYSALSEYTYNFRVFKQPGLVWWAIMLIVIAALAVAAAVLFILWKRGVFQILTQKLIVSIRTKATVDATIAAVRVSRAEAEARAALAAAEAAERAKKQKEALEAANKPAPEKLAKPEGTKPAKEGESVKDKPAKGAQTHAEEKPVKEAQAEQSEKPAEEQPAAQPAKPEAAKPDEAKPEPPAEPAHHEEEHAEQPEMLESDSAEQEEAANAEASQDQGNDASEN